ncbi:MAG: lytic transglycosylase domain-containing protein [Clostridiales bacterium]|nr:lytic transglycosylase domain-containing protein [Clostridiales bacterium]
MRKQSNVHKDEQKRIWDAYQKPHSNDHPFDPENNEGYLMDAENADGNLTGENDYFQDEPPYYQQRNQPATPWDGEEEFQKRRRNPRGQRHAPAQLPVHQKEDRNFSPETKRKKKRSRGYIALVTSCIVLILILGGLIAFKGFMELQLADIFDRREKNHERLLNLYPLGYRQLIEEEAEKYNLDPAFVAAIILNESSFQKRAESSVGARGLMQLMEDTAGWIAQKTGEEEGFHFDLMFQPEINIRYGSWYLHFLSGRFNGDPILVAAAYHAGQGEVGNWLKDSRYSEDGQKIPLEKMIEGPTKNYVTKVTKAYEQYKGLYYTN